MRHSSLYAATLEAYQSGRGERRPLAALFFVAQSKRSRDLDFDHFC